MNKFNTHTAAGLDAIIQVASGATANTFWFETGLKPCELITALAREVKALREEKEAGNETI